MARTLSKDVPTTFPCRTYIVFGVGSSLLNLSSNKNGGES